MSRTGKNLLIGAALLAMAGSAGIVYAQSASSSLLNTLEKGLWELRAIGGGPSRAAQSRICIGDVSKLIQIQHGSTKCTQRILSEKADRVTITYSCPGAGQGVTTIRKESNRLIQIESQGIRNGSPFNFEVEGRRSGGC